MSLFLLYTIFWLCATVVATAMFSVGNVDDGSVVLLALALSVVSYLVNKE